jgi:hypothetical protein
MFGLSKIWQGEDWMIFEYVQGLIDDVLLCYNFIFAEEEGTLAQYNPEDTELVQGRVAVIPEDVLLGSHGTWQEPIPEVDTPAPSAGDEDICVNPPASYLYCVGMSVLGWF